MQSGIRRVGSRQLSDGTISQCYEFAHALYRDVFYRRQAPGRRARLQRRIEERAGLPGVNYLGRPEATRPAKIIVANHAGPAPLLAA
jgi:hypothetical protein